jgi:hypothetical protein|tara:strand:- start:4253 stop:4996 length:744 start_codon:yes stop_codon:yes gene_type:complete
MEPLTVLLVFLIGLISSLLSALIGGGAALIIVPFLMSLGLPPQVAIATNKFGGLGLATSAIYKFTKEKKIVFEYAIPRAVISIIGAFIGARMLIEVNEAVLSKLIGIIVLLILPILFLRKIGLERIIKTKKSIVVGYSLSMIVAIYGGFFGGGAGILSSYIFIIFFGLTYIQASATSRIPQLAGLITSLTVFILYGLVNYYYGFILLLGCLIGWYLGSHFAVKKGNSFVKILFVIFVIVLGLKLVLF